MRKNTHDIRTLTGPMARQVLTAVLLLVSMTGMAAPSAWLPKEAPATAKTVSRYKFSHYLGLMRYGAKGRTLADYRSHAAQLGLNLVFHETENAEVYMVWAHDMDYSKDGMTEHYSPTGPSPRCLNVDLTNGGGQRFVPITITIAFPSQAEQQAFREQGIRLGCQVNGTPEDTDIDASWQHVSGLKYIIDEKRLNSWRFIYFYEKDGLYLCTFLF